MTTSRRLAAILAADVTGYSRLMGEDEAGTLATVRRIRTEVIERKVAEHQGRLFKSMGDGFLVEFASVVNAVACAAAIQKAMAARNADQPEDKVIQLRIGVHLGDVISEDGDVYGDGVNVAARIEGLAPPGGVAISAMVHDTVGRRLDLAFEDMGEQHLKNIAKPVHVYQLATRTELVVTPAQSQRTKPSILVLPFTNMSGDAEQEYFSDGITEDLITELSKFHSLFVISRNSAFALKSQSINVAEIGQKLRVRYVVEGSVRRSAGRLRITAQLIDATEDAHLWADRYDRQLADIFDVQDEVVQAIVTAIEPKILSSERNRALRKPPENLDAWESYQRGLWYTFQYDPDDRDRALGFFRRAIELDPGFASAYAGLGYALYVYIILGVSPNRLDDIAQAFEVSKTALRLNARDPFGWVALSRAHLLRSELEAAVVAAENAIALNPNLALAHFARAHTLWHAGRPQEAVVSHDEAIRLSPLDPVMSSFLASKSIALVLLGQYAEAIAVSQQSQQQATSAIFSHLGEISALGQLGRRGEAEMAIGRARLKKPDVSIAYVDQTLPISEPHCRNTFLDGLRKAGLPEE